MTAVGQLFNRRFKGFRVVELAMVGLLAVMILAVYAFKAGAGRESARIAEVDKSIAEEGRRVRLLKAEIARLEEPGRLTRLSTAYLGMAPADAKRETTADSLPELSRHPATPPAPVASAPAAPVPAPAPPAEVVAR